MSPQEMRKEFKIWLNSLGKTDLKKFTSYAEELTEKSLIKKETVIKHALEQLFHDYCTARNTGKQLKISLEKLKEMTRKSFESADRAVWGGYARRDNMKDTTPRNKKLKLKTRKIV